MTLDPRPGASLGTVNSAAEIAYLRAGSEPGWERPYREGVDVTDSPDLQTPYQSLRRVEFEARVESYRAGGLL